MQIHDEWRALGYKHIAWELLRYYLSIRGGKNQAQWLSYLREHNALQTDKGQLAIPADVIRLLLGYLDVREDYFSDAFDRLRTEDEARRFCEDNGIAFGTTATRNRDHHQASKALVATVSAIAQGECERRGIEIDPDPQKRCVWCSNNGLHVTARNLDGAVPSIVNPVIVWEIKEYWGKTSGGSKMSDAVYECNLVGRELRDFEQASGVAVVHAVFVDGKGQWTARKSDLKRFIDLLNQGLVDMLFVGRDVENEWGAALSAVLDSNISS